VLIPSQNSVVRRMSSPSQQHLSQSPTCNNILISVHTKDYPIFPPQSSRSTKQINTPIPRVYSSPHSSGARPSHKTSHPPTADMCFLVCTRCPSRTHCDRFAGRNRPPHGSVLTLHPTGTEYQSPLSLRPESPGALMPTPAPTVTEQC
jgi:hypothetical protein